MNSRINFLISLFLLMIIGFTVNAQKLPKVQTNGLRAPANVKTDGQATEWHNQFQAYNRNTEIFYTIANDNDKLYLTVQATKPVIIDKIIRAGITFIINHTIDKKDKDAVSVTFPMLDKADKQIVGHTVMHKLDKTNDSLVIKRETDSIRHVLNAQMMAKLKVIMVKGVKALDDTMISVYNLDGIKAAALFDNKLAYTYELAIPLKYLGIIADNHNQFSYHIVLNDITLDMGNMSPKDIKSISVSGGAITLEGIGGQVMSFNAPMGATDFWGEYKLANGK